jgi:hypothetical protein
LYAGYGEVHLAQVVDWAVSDKEGQALIFPKCFFGCS